MGAGHPTTKTRIWRPNTATRPQIHHPHPPPPNTPRKTPNRSRAIGSTRFTGGSILTSQSRPSAWRRRSRTWFGLTACWW
jgi:hypothetical protein